MSTQTSDRIALAIFILGSCVFAANSAWQKHVRSDEYLKKSNPREFYRMEKAGIQNQIEMKRYLLLSISNDLKKLQNNFSLEVEGAAIQPPGIGSDVARMMVQSKIEELRAEVILKAKAVKQLANEIASLSEVLVEVEKDEVRRQDPG